jgi:hypothetical protein
MKKASEMLKDHVDQLEKSMGKQEIKVLESFKNSVYSLCNIIEENQLFKIVELAGEIEMKFGQLTEGISAEYKIKNLSLY